MTLRSLVLALVLLGSIGISSGDQPGCPPTADGIRLREAGRYDAAAESFAKAIDSNDARCTQTRASSLAMLAEVQAAQGKPQLAIDLLKQSLQVAPPKEFDTRQQLLAALLMNEGRPVEASMLLRQLTARASTEDHPRLLQLAVVLRSLAVANLAAGDVSGAEESYARAIEILESEGAYSEACRMRVEMAVHLEELGRIDEARRQFETIASHADQDALRASAACLDDYLAFLGRHGPNEDEPRARVLLERAGAMERQYPAPDFSPGVVPND